jgi:hypothetical protein
MRADLAFAMERLGGFDAAHRSLVDHLDAVLAPQTDLWDCCPLAADCWRPGVIRPPTPHQYRVPYVGPQYMSRGIVLVGMNSRDDGLSDVAFRGMADMLASFRSGRRSWGGPFQYRAARLVGLLAASQDAGPLDEEPSLDKLADLLLESARVQAVQCSPGPMNSRRSPRPQMWRNCPSLIVEEQIRVLNPSVVALLGTGTLRAIQRLEALKVQWNSLWRENNNCFARGTLQAENQTAALFALFHPSYVGRWTRSITALKQSLEEHPVHLP